MPTKDDGWWFMLSAPHTCEVEVKLRDGTTCIANWAQERSGEEQPAFYGWFVSVKDAQGKVSYYRQVEPVEWREISE